jgi:hypothetical protein
MGRVQNLVQRVVASIFVLFGGIAMVGWIWPDGAIDTLAKILEAALAILGLGITLAVVLSLWSSDDLDPPSQ